MRKPDIEIYPEIEDYRKLMDWVSERFKDNIAYKYRENREDKNSPIIEKTYETVVEDVRALATSFLKKGWKGKRIAIIGSNRYEWVVPYFATLSGGMIAAPMDKLLPDKEIESITTRAEIDVVVFEKKYLDVFKNIKKNKDNNVKHLICMDDIEDKEVEKLSDLIEEGKKLVEDGNDLYDKVKIDRNEMSIMLFTSGTTSQSKIVMLSQGNILGNIWGYQPYFKMLPTDTVLSILPIHHTFESSITIMYGFYSGATVAFCDGLRHIADNLKEYEISVFVAVPLLLETMYKKILKGIDAQGKTKLVNTMIKVSNGLRKCHIDLRRKLFKQVIDQMGGKLRMVLYGGAKLDKETTIGYDNFGIISIQGYGLTETSPVLTAETESRHNPGSAGLPLEAVELKIYEPDKDGVGEVLAKGPNVFLGYYNDEAKTEEAFIDGWFRTGDYGYIDNGGWLWLTGRKNDIIVLKNGKNVYPEEIETLINRISYIKESMVYARDDSETDTLLAAKIVYDPDEMKRVFPDKEKDDYQDIIFDAIKKINKDLPTFKHVKKIEITDEPMEKTTTQKIKRYVEKKKMK